MIMATDNKVIRQNAGFCKNEAERAREHLERARQFQADGNDRAAKALQTRAMNEMTRVAKAAETIKNRTDKK